MSQQHPDTENYVTAWLRNEIAMCEKWCEILRDATIPAFQQSYAKYSAQLQQCQDALAKLEQPQSSINTHQSTI